MNEVKELVEELRNKKSRDNRELLDRAADRIEELKKQLTSVLTNEDKVSVKGKCIEEMLVEELAAFLWHNTNMYDEDLIFDVAEALVNAGYLKQSKGEWIGEADGYADGELVYDVWHCSECNHCIDDGTDDPDLLPNFCPNCGAKMKGGEKQ